MAARRPSLTVALAAVLAAVAVGTGAGLVLLWPEERSVEGAEGLARPETERAEIVAIAAGECLTPGRPDCLRVEIELETGPDAGTRTGLDVGAELDPEIGQEIRVYRTGLPPDAVIGGVAADPYSFADFERRAPLVWLALAFAALVLVTSRLRGLRALLGLAASLGVVVFFVVPAILDGRAPLAVATVGALAVMLVTIPLAHGLGAKTLAACLGTATSLALVLALASAFIELAHLSGFSSEEATFLQATGSGLSIQGLLLAGMVIGALGVLDDLTVSQASTVMALKRADPSLGLGPLFRSALSVGHDHIAATVNTLVLAYAGAALPVLLVFSLAEVSFAAAVTSEVVAEEVVAMLVGSIGLVAAVPITTGLAALLAARLGAAGVGRVRGPHAD